MPFKKESSSIRSTAEIETPEFKGNGNTAPNSPKVPDQKLVTHLRFYGLFRGNANALISFQEGIGKDPKYFKLPEGWLTDRRIVIEAAGDEFAGMVRYDFELLEPIRTDAAKQ